VRGFAARRAADFLARPANVLLCVSKASRISFRRRFLARCAFMCASYRAMRAAWASSAWRARVASRKALLDMGILVLWGRRRGRRVAEAAPQQVLLCRDERSGAARRLLGGASGVRWLAPGAYGAFPACSRAPKAPRRASAISGFGFGLNFSDASEHVSDRRRRRSEASKRPFCNQGNSHPT